MRNKILISLVIMLFLSSSTLVQATKIQKGDTWKYETIDNIEFNETALEVVQLKYGYDTIAVIDMNTTKPYIFDMNVNIFDTFNLSTEINMNYNTIYYTQEGSIPYIVDDIAYEGFIHYNNYSYDISNASYIVTYHGDPSIALITTSSTVFYISYSIIFSPTHSFFVYRDYIISSDNNVGDIIKKFTITPDRYGFVYSDNDNDIMINWEFEPNNLKLNSFETAMELTYEEGINQPIHITQTEPVIINGLQLSQSTELIEYFLIRDIVEISNEDGLEFNFIYMLFILLPIIKYKQKF
jgi:hypothetical protein